jgi:hypothetical protein
MQINCIEDDNKKIATPTNAYLFYLFIFVDMLMDR